MSSSHNAKTLLMTFAAAFALSGCGGGADKVVSPGTPSNPPAPTPTPSPTPTPTPSPGGSAAESCPDGTVNQGTIASDSLRACRLPSEILGDLTLRNIDGVAYQIQGQVNVGQDQLGDSAVNDASKRGRLLIEPGVTLFGSSGPDVLLVQRGSQIHALGTREQPIVFTSRNDLEGNGAKFDWAGVVLMGRAPINNCIGGATPGAADCQGAVEGTSNAYGGGNDPTDSSGEMSYVQIRYSGYVLGAGNELQSLTLVGVGSGTKIDHFQSHYSGDDGIEIFGGTVNLSHIVITEADDDSLDTDWGWSGGVQYGLVVRKTPSVKGVADSGSIFEWSALDQTPTSTPKVSNFTVYTTDPTLDSLVKVNQGTNAYVWNSVLVTAPASANQKQADVCFDITGTGTGIELLSNHFTCDKRDKNSETTAKVDAATKTGTVFGASTLTSAYINGQNENAVTPAAVNAKHGFFDDVDYIGAAKDANDAWWQGWTVGLE
ncbi:hypothetical protein [Stenotrophomonas sp. MMGLT7]|uniref:hypothetical protein n=1 Tax=Stenotrophomonas sp. MMGLT7 TaxID=2901227 RepID=UPI001E28D5DB|nr:hypothetical protein [Stenotrophomonas sp. MMGLT7]MCD7098939.1 hypothetical protein [Stenotrophomonas sp. MMGLT7]